MAAHIRECISNSKITASSSPSSSSSSSSPRLSHTEIHSLIHTSLHHLDVFTPHSSTSVLDTLSSLPSYLLTEPFAHFSARRRISNLILNDLSAFIWQDRLEEMNAASFSLNSTNEQSSNYQINKSPASSMPVHQYYRLLTSSLRSIQSLFCCKIIATSSSLATPTLFTNTNSNANNNNNNITLRPYLPAIWTNFRTVQLILQRPPPLKFRRGISAHEAESKRNESTDEAGRTNGYEGDQQIHIAKVNWWESDSWKEDVRIGVRRWEISWGRGG